MRIVLDGNAFYEIDEECLARRKREPTEAEDGPNPEGRKKENSLGEKKRTISE
ncbi:MAG: hypothetical protein SOZ59_06495 [Candidatus Limivivens sp.]|nr:hypothetical protein [Candidatus Limivivens sp.]